MQGKVFISYARVNLPLVERLERDLLVADVDIWRDQHEIMPGKTWDETIERALRASAAVIVVLTQASVQSQAVRNEIAVAQNMGKWVFPVRFEPCDVPMVIARLHYTDFVHDYDSGLRHLLAALNQALGAATLLAIPIPPPRPASPQPPTAPTPAPMPEHRDPPPAAASTPPPVVKPPIVPPPPPKQEPVPERARPVVAEPRNSRAPLIIAAGLAGLLAVALVWYFAKPTSGEGKIPTQTNSSSLVTSTSSTDTVTTIAQASDTAATVTTSTSPGSTTTAASESTTTTKTAARPQAHKIKPKPAAAFVCEPEKLPQCCAQSIDPKACRECKKREGLQDECP